MKIQLGTFILAGTALAWARFIVHYMLSSSQGNDGEDFTSSDYDADSSLVSADESSLFVAEVAKCQRWFMVQ